MRLKLMTVLFAAGTLAACASNPPPPPPMADAAPPPPPPSSMPMSGPMTGMYKGMADNAANPRGCAKMTRASTVRVMANNTFSFMGMRGMIGPDGTISSRAMRGGSLSGMASAGGLDMNVMKGKCTYHYTLNKA